MYETNWRYCPICNFKTSALISHITSVHGIELLTYRSIDKNIIECFSCPCGEERVLIDFDVIYNHITKSGDKHTLILMMAAEK